jgi:hypothetical protein
MAGKVLKMERADYLAFRRQYQPVSPRLIIVAESPPFSGKYFYNSEGAATEPLFSAVMQQIGVKPLSKQQGLRQLKEMGWMLVDATYEPVNDYAGSKKDLVILRDYPQLLDDLTHISPNRNVPIVLIKVNVCRLLDGRLSNDGFDVINRGKAIPFPSSGQQGKFRADFSETLQRAGLKGESSQIKPNHGVD